MSRVFIGIGSNLGDRQAHLSMAAQRLSHMAGVRLVQMAPIYETKPVGGPPQDDFLNTVVELETSLEPDVLLRAMKQLERELGRAPSGVRNSPRAIDLDLLLYDDRVVQTADLTIPHPRLHERWFVLEPLAQLAPDVVHPTLRRTIADLLAQVPAPTLR